MSISLKIANNFPSLRKRFLRRIYRKNGLLLQDLIPVQDGRFFFYKIDGTYFPNETLHEKVSFPALYGKAKNESLFIYEPVEGDVVIDLGAGLGEETLIYSKLVGPRGKVIAIEAEPTVFSVLEETIQRNKLQNVDAFQIAISQKAGSVSMKTPGDSYEAGFVTQELNEAPAVPAKTLSSLIKQTGLSRIDLLKVNIEGSERYAVESLTDDDYKIIRNVAIACHDFRYKREGNDFFRTKELVASSLQKNNFHVIRRESSVDYLADWIYATNKSTSE